VVGVEQVEQVEQVEDDKKQGFLSLTSRRDVDIKPVEDIKPEPIELVKAKTKRTTKKNNIVIEDVKPVVEEIKPTEEIKPVVEEIKPVVEEIKPKNIKTVELVACNKCNKQMTKNTLRYHHEKSCPGKPIDTQALPVKRRIKKEQPTKANKEEKAQVNNKQPTYRDKLNERNLKRKESISKLALQIA